ncbi:hypothetical protein [Haloarcula salinisoli]|uniref:Uncharacterized protein n=1 Tax=Haloarcula salinisoli TaxID=2487746 RepID=A0A8J7YL30_9EURY|nr:hypothetical protein [Halomicroarcula salinisoli]MBX0288483.1 hypothetical protein [Halomicroarcula salinisoli]MBX0305703.1 hypothetical protein [Halomicroarcula salinisoli]
MDAEEWRLCYAVGGLTHYTEWCGEFHRVAALYEQYQQGPYASAVRIEAREVIREAE